MNQPDTVNPNGRRWLRAAVVALLAAPLLALAGCQALGIAAAAMPERVDARYEGLKDQKVAVMVWADDGVLADFPNLRLDIAQGVQRRLQEAQKNKKREVEGARFVNAASVVRFQEEHPGIDAIPIDQVAPRLGADRVIYIEVTDFQTRSAESVDLYRGQIIAHLKVLEVLPDNAAGPVATAGATSVPGRRTRTAYEDPAVRTVFPENVPDEGTPNFGDARIYRGTLLAFTDEVAGRFYTFERERKLLADVR